MVAARDAGALVPGGAAAPPSPPVSIIVTRAFRYGGRPVAVGTVIDQVEQREALQFVAWRKAEILPPEAPPIAADAAEQDEDE